MAVIPDRDVVPDPMLDREQWICWTVQMRDGDETKVPKDPSGGFASTNDPDTWANFDAAVDHAREKGYEGIGFVFSPEDIFVGIDLDCCRDPETGQLEQWAIDIIKTIGSYTEISPSGYGIHIIALGFKPDGANRNGQYNEIESLKDVDKGPDVEMYDRGRYFTFTGDTRDLLPTELRQANASVHEVWEEYIEDDEDEEEEDDEEAAEPVEFNIPSDDNILLQKARRAENGQKFKDLYDNGDWQPYQHEWNAPSTADDARSEADFALATMLAFWTGEDKFRMERLFNASALGQRDKWRNRADYRDRTLRNAIKTNDMRYNPRYHIDNEDSEDENADADEEVAADD